MNYLAQKKLNQEGDKKSNILYHENTTITT